MPQTAGKPANKAVGSAIPRINPPLPLRTELKSYVGVAEKLGLKLYPWQETAGKYLTAVGPSGKWLYREVAVIVARQNGKTTLLVPLIVERLLAGQKIMHTAQNAKLPRDVHEEVAAAITEHYPEMLPKSRGISYALGSETITLVNGAKYRIVSPTRGGARGPSNDTVIIDELREMDTHDFIGAAKPTLTASRKPQMVYLSNAGTEESAVLNGLKMRGEVDPVLAYLEWSAPPDVAADDIRGWIASNPSIGHDPAVLETLTTEYRSNMLAGTLSIFETEHLCRWVTTLRENLVDAQSWNRCRRDVGAPVRPSLAVSMDPNGRRASVAMAWRLGEGVAVTILSDVSGDPINTDDIGRSLKAAVLKYGVRQVGFDPSTDRELVKYVKKQHAIPVAGQRFAAASSQFANIVRAEFLSWQDADSVTDDLTWTSRKSYGDAGGYEAVRASEDRPVTASLAAVRAVGLASGPSPATPRVL